MSCPYVSTQRVPTPARLPPRYGGQALPLAPGTLMYQLPPVRLSVRTLFDALSVTKDRVIDCIIDHPTIVVRETHYWCCPVCNAVAGQESMRCAEAIEQISISA